MQLTELFLDRWLYRAQQDTATKDSEYMSANQNAVSNILASGNSVFDINTNALYINGAVIGQGTIPSASLNIADLGWTGTSALSATGADTVSWGAGTFRSADGVTILSIGAGSTGIMTQKTYIYLDTAISTTAYQISTNVNDPLGVGKVLIAVASPGVPLASFIGVQTTQIVGDNIIGNTINATKITAGSITATQLSTSILYAGTITLDTGGAIKGGQTTYDSGSGFFLGSVGGAYKFSVGNSAGNKITWDGSTLSIAGTITGYIPTGGGAADINAGFTLIQGGKITTNSIIANQLNVSTLSSITADMGSITAGDITFKQSNDSQTGYLRWQGGSKMWEDTSNYLGLTSTGERIYFYTGQTHLYALFQRNSQAEFYTGVSSQGPFNVTGSNNARFGNNVYFGASGTTEYIWGGSAHLDLGAYSYISLLSTEVKLNFLTAIGGSPQIGTSSARFYVYGSTVRYTTLTNDSDERLKKNIEPMLYGLEEVKKLKPVKFEYKENDQGVHLGFVAQDLEGVLPELVSEDDETNMKCLATTELIPVLVKAIQELSKEVELLKKQ